MIKFIVEQQYFELDGDRLNKLAMNIKFFREQKNWTQKELAQKLGISRSVVAKWENENALPDIETLISLSKLFEVSIDYLVGLSQYRDNILMEMKHLYKTDGETNLDSNQLIEVVDYLYKNAKLQEYLLKLNQLPLKDRKMIEKILFVMIDEFYKR